jgi:hypothetical protein
MMQHQVRSEKDALAYIVDCTLATVCDLAGKKSAKKYELARQISIAQTGLDWMRIYGVDFSCTRAFDVYEKFGGIVADWAEQWKPTC